MEQRYKDICERAICQREYIPQHPEVWGEYPQYPRGPLISAVNMTISDPLESLLILYGEDGHEYNIDHNRIIHVKEEVPCRGFFHKHEFIEILYVIEGSFEQILLGEHLHFEQGEVVITDQNCEHADYITAANNSVLFLQIHADYLNRLLHSYDGRDELQKFLLHSLGRQKREQSFLTLHPYNPKWQRDSELEECLEQLVYENDMRLPGYELIRDGLLLRLLSHLCTHYSQTLHSGSQEVKEKATLYEVERYIRKHLQTVTIHELEEVFHYHRNYYNILLQKYRGMSFRRYVQKVRMDYAKQLLTHGNLPIRQIAALCGYENTSFFYHLFEETFGYRPSDIKKKE